MLSILVFLLVYNINFSVDKPNALQSSNIITTETGCDVESPCPQAFNEVCGEYQCVELIPVLGGYAPISTTKDLPGKKIVVTPSTGFN